MSTEKKKVIAERIIPLMEKLPPESQERILAYTQGVVDQKEYETAKTDKEAS